MEIVSRSPRARLGVDLDGTIARSFDELLRRGLPCTPESFVKVWRGWRGIGLVDVGVPTYVNALAGRYIPLLVTATSGNPDDVAQWVDAKGIWFDDLLFVGRDEKHKYCDILVDDDPRTLNDLADRGKHGILLRPTGDMERLHTANRSVRQFGSWFRIYQYLSRR